MKITKEEFMAQSPDKTTLVVGGGISGLTTAIEAAETGASVVIVERNPYLGGRVAQLFRYFPKLCPPYCGLEINFRRIKQNPAISFYTMAEIESIEGSAGNFRVRIKQDPRYVNEKCTACNACVEACPVERPNDFNFGMDSTKAIYLPHEMSFPMRFVIDDKYCKGKECAKCVEACKYNAIDLEMKSAIKELSVANIVFATGWNPYDASRMDNLGFGKVKNVITNMMMERLSAPNGPTKGKIQRPSDGKDVTNIAFVQCAGSRDENHLNYCSAICCMASLKQSTYIREKNPDSKATIFYIDLRAPGKYEDFLRKVDADENIVMVKGKVAKIEEDPETQDVIVTVEDIAGGKKIHERFDMVVLATGMEPQTASKKFPGNLKLEDNGFIHMEQTDGILSVGVAKKPSDVTGSVQDATASAIKTLQTLAGGN
jgi:quinone-modifying oxidoreductase subunit QmoA